MNISKDFTLTKLVPFSSIAAGDFFVVGSTIYLKIAKSPNETKNALSLEGLVPVFFSSIEKVEPLYAELKLSKNPIVSVTYPDYPWINPSPIPNSNPTWISTTGKLSTWNTPGVPLGGYTTVYCEGVCDGS